MRRRVALASNLNVDSSVCACRTESSGLAVKDGFGEQQDFRLTITLLHDAVDYTTPLSTRLTPIRACADRPSASVLARFA